MAQSKATTVAAYLDEQPPERRAELEKVLRVVRKHMPKGYAEGMAWGMIGWVVPLSVMAETYNGLPLCYAGLASQKNYMSLYLMPIYGDKKTEKWFRGAFAAAGKKLDCGKCCGRVKKLEDLPLDVIGKAVAMFPMKKWVEIYEDSREKLAARKKELQPVILRASE